MASSVSQGEVSPSLSHPKRQRKQDGPGSVQDKYRNSRVVLHRFGEPARATGAEGCWTMVGERRRGQARPSTAGAFAGGPPIDIDGGALRSRNRTDQRAGRK